MFCPNCGTKNLEDAKFCSKCGTALSTQKLIEESSTLSEDKLERHWYWIIWGSLIVPYIGIWIIIILSSVMYYRWKKTYPKKAKAINKHGWLAWLTGNIVWALVYFASQ